MFAARTPTAARQLPVMRWTQAFIPTLKETPAEAEIPSHKLLLRAGLIRKLTGGLYTFLPLGLRSLRKIEQIVRQEMDRAGALELLMPSLQPPEIWQQSGRYETWREVLFKLRPRQKGMAAGTHARRGDHEPGGGRDQFVPPTAEKLLPDSNEVPR